MERTQSQFRRLIELDNCMRRKQYPNCLTFAKEWGVSQKTVQRDIDYLRDQHGAPIEYDRDRKGFYYTNHAWFLPALFMSEGDLFALLLASRASEAYKGTPVAKRLEQIFSKIAELLPDQVSIQPELVHAKFSFTAPPAKPVQEEVWTTVVRGLTTRRLVRMKYRSFESREATDRNLAPYHIANLQGEWYVFGATDKSPEVRQYSLGRIHSATLTAVPFEIPADFDPESMLASTFGRFALGGKAYEVRLLFDHSVEEWVLERQWHPKQKVVKRKTGEIELRFKAMGLFEVMRWVLAWGEHVTVLAPMELKQAVTDEVRTMAKKLSLL